MCFTWLVDKRSVRRYRPSDWKWDIRLHNFNNAKSSTLGQLYEFCSSTWPYSMPCSQSLHIIMSFLTAYPEVLNGCLLLVLQVTLQFISRVTGSFWLSTDVPKLSPTIISIFASIVVIRRFLLKFSFLVLSLLGTPHNLLSMCMSATCTLVCHMFVALHSAPHKYTRPNCLSFKRSPFNLRSIC